MSWWSRLAAEFRAVFLRPSPEYWPYAAPTVSGEPVTVERAVALTAVWASVNLIAGTIASMPLILYRRDAEGDRERYVDHPLYELLRTRPNPVMPAVQFWENVVTSLLLRGNGYAMLTRDDDGRIRAMWYCHPDAVSVEVLSTGKLRYRVMPPSGGQVTLPEGGMLHVVGPLSRDGYLGRSVVTTFRETLGLGLALERYGSEFFANAATPKGVFTTAHRLSDAARERLKTSIAEQQTAPGHRHKTLVLEEDMKWQSLSLSQEDSQFLATKKFGVTEIARVFGIPAHMIGGEIAGTTLTYSNSESQSLQFLKHTIQPWLSRIAGAVNHVCIPPLERFQMFAEHLPDALLETDTAGRYAAYQTGIAAGFLTVDEVRRRENLPALGAPRVG